MVEAQRSGGTHRWGRVLAALVGALVLGTAIAVAPFWFGLGADLEPTGEACWFEHDPGSGRSAVGVERIEWGVAPQRVCAVVGSVNLPTSGPEFDAAVEARQLADTRGEAPVDVNRMYPLYGSVWPVAALLLTVGILMVGWFVVWQVGADRRTKAAVG